MGLELLVVLYTPHATLARRATLAWSATLAPHAGQVLRS